MLPYLDAVGFMIVAFVLAAPLVLLAVYFIFQIVSFAVARSEMRRREEALALRRAAAGGPDEGQKGGESRAA
jgi:hypothetical protein